jgi:hypothetical protein
VIAAEKTDTLTLSKQNYENIVIREFPEIGNEIKTLADIRKQRFVECEENLNKTVMFNKKIKTQTQTIMRPLDTNSDKKEDAHLLTPNRDEHSPNPQNENLNILSTEANLLSSQRGNFNKGFGERHDSLKANEAKLKTAEEQLKFFQQISGVSKSEKSKKDEESADRNNLIIVETESNMAKEGEEPISSKNKSIS